MAWDKKSYDADYYKKNIFCKRLPFNRSIPEGQRNKKIAVMEIVVKQQPAAFFPGFLIPVDLTFPGNLIPDRSRLRIIRPGRIKMEDLL